MSHATPDKNRPLPEMAADIIRDYINRNNLQVGDKLPNEFQLGQLCDVGRSTIREAIKILVFEGLVEIIRGNGTFVAKEKAEDGNGDVTAGFWDSFDLPKQALEFFDVRLMLEPEVAAMAAANATYEDCQHLDICRKAVEACVYSKRDHLQADIQFHMQIAESSKNKVVYNLMEIIVQGIPVFVEATNNSLTHDTLEQHKEIYEAIITGDAVGARCAMITHLNHNRQRIINVMKEQQSQK